MNKSFNVLMRWIYDVRLEASFLMGFFRHRLPNSDEDVVVSMTSYPARIRGAWVSLESLFRQDYKAFRLILVLAESQFPGKELPLIIRLMMRKGLTILWVAEDNRSWDHLWPAYSSFPQASVISVDDDKVFPGDLVRRLVEASRQNPGRIIGSRGWEMRMDSGALSFGKGWVRAAASTPSEALFMPPGNGSLYPPGSLPTLAGDVELMRKICPRADDVWYWAAARLAATESVCLALEAHRPSRAQRNTRALADEDPGPAEFRAVLNEFGHEALVVDQLDPA